MPRSIWRCLLPTGKKFYLSELLVCDGQTAYLSVFWQEGLDTLEVDIGILATGTMAHVDRELEHRETICQLAQWSIVQNCRPAFQCVLQVGHCEATGRPDWRNKVCALSQSILPYFNYSANMVDADLDYTF